MPRLTANLLSVSEITAKQKQIVFTSKGCVIQDLNGVMLATGTLVNDLYKLGG